RLERRPEHVVAPNGRDELLAILAGAGHFGRVVADDVVTVHEVEDELPVAERRDERMIDFPPNFVPSHVRHFEAAAMAVELDHTGIEPAEPVIGSMLGAVPGKELEYQ